MLWLALHLPALPLEALTYDPASPEPLAVVEGGAVLVCDAKAYALGVRRGMGLAAARALAPQLVARPRNERRERAALEGIAAWLCGFTPAVSLEPPHDLLAEVEGSLRLFGGLAALVERLRRGLDEIGFGGTLAAAPTARAALWLACAGQEELIEEATELRPALAALPAAVACAEPAARELLHNIGVASIGKLLKLPRAGVARRFGERLLDDLDRALGSLPEPRIFFKPAPRFAAKLEFDAEVLHAEGVLFAARRLLAQLEGLLAAQQAGIRRFTLTLAHRRGEPSVVEIGLGSPGREAERFVQLLRERLGALGAVAPIEAIRIEAGEFEPFAASTAGLFADARSDAENWARLVERLRARLGDAVHGLALHEDHRPELASRSVEVDAQASKIEAPAAPRPLWIFDAPRPLQDREGAPQYEGALELLAGPERIESGWWDGREVRRDYFVARAPNAALLWVFREAGGGWYLHGVFS